MEKIKIGDRNKKFLVAEMTERQKKIAQMKARLYRGSLNEFVIKAIDEFDVSLPSRKCSCGNMMRVIKEDIKYPISMGDIGEEVEHVILIKRYPRWRCKICNKEGRDVFNDSVFEKLMEFEILDYLNRRSRGKLPKTIDFNDLIKM